MSKLKALRPSPALVISAIALFVAIGGISWAAATITAKDIKKNAVTTKKIKNKAVTGPKLSDDERTLWAAVQDNGTIAAQSGGISVTRTTDGGYTVTFPADLSGRGLVATGAKARTVVTASLCNGGTGVGSDCSGFAPNDSRHVGVNTALAVATPATFTDLPFYVAALPK